MSKLKLPSITTYDYIGICLSLVVLLFLGFVCGISAVIIWSSKPAIVALGTAYILIIALASAVFAATSLTFFKLAFELIRQPSNEELLRHLNGKF